MKLVVTAVYGEEEVLFPTVVGDGRKTFKWLGEWSFAAASRGFGRPLADKAHFHRPQHRRTLLPKKASW